MESLNEQVRILPFALGTCPKKHQIESVWNVGVLYNAAPTFHTRKRADVVGSRPSKIQAKCRFESCRLL